MINILRTVSLFFLLFINDHYAYCLPANNYNNRRLESIRKYVLNKYNERFEVFDELKEKLSILDKPNLPSALNELGVYHSTPYFDTLDDLMCVDKTFWEHDNPAIIQVIVDPDIKQSYMYTHKKNPVGTYDNCVDDNNCIYDNNCVDDNCDDINPMYWIIYLDKTKSSVKYGYDEKHDISIRCKDSIMIGIILNTLNPITGFLKGDISIKPIHKISLMKRFHKITKKWKKTILNI